MLAHSGPHQEILDGTECGSGRSTRGDALLNAAGNQQGVDLIQVENRLVLQCKSQVSCRMSTRAMSGGGGVCCVSGTPLVAVISKRMATSRASASYR